jgi:hypothetical protein
VTKTIQQQNFEPTAASVTLATIVEEDEDYDVIIKDIRTRAVDELVETYNEASNAFKGV